MSDGAKRAHPAALALSAVAVLYFGWVLFLAAERPSPLMFGLFALLIVLNLVFLITEIRKRMK